MFNILERKLIGKISALKNGNVPEENVVETKKTIARWLNQMKDIDEPTYERLLKKYKSV